LLGLNDAIEKLAALDRRQASIVTYRFFGGLTEEQIADVLGVSTRTVEADWRHARAWLKRELSRTDPS
jgi:RNA polymerase sigma factor (sigma-70 family)